MAMMTPSTIGGLIDAIGTPRFDQVFLQAARRLAGADHYSAFRFAGDSLVRHVGSASVGDRAEARMAADKFISRLHWRLDPARSRLVGRSLARRPVLLRIFRDDIVDPAYRQDCYEAPDIIDRLSIYRDVGVGVRYRLSLYRKRGSGHFAEEAISAVAEAAEILLAAVVKHGERQAAGPDQPALPRVGLSEAVDRLLGLGARLTTREVEVLARGLMGKTSEGIALDLGIALSSVTTYRKRAYRKLGITGQPELFALVLGAEPRAA